MKLWFMSNLLLPSLQSCTTKGLCRMSSATVTHQMLSFHCSCFQLGGQRCPFFCVFSHTSMYSVLTTNTPVPSSLHGVDLYSGHWVGNLPKLRAWWYPSFELIRMCNEFSLHRLPTLDAVNCTRISLDKVNVK